MGLLLALALCPLAHAQIEGLGSLYQGAAEDAEIAYRLTVTVRGEEQVYDVKYRVHALGVLTVELLETRTRVAVGGQPPKQAPPGKLIRRYFRRDNLKGPVALGPYASRAGRA